MKMKVGHRLTNIQEIENNKNNKQANKQTNNKTTTTTIENCVLFCPEIHASLSKRSRLYMYLDMFHDLLAQLKT